jgi:hypothetical protein
MDYQLFWKGRLWTVGVPAAVVGDRARWTYVQGFVASGGSQTEAMQHVLRLQYPGIGWTGFTTPGFTTPGFTTPGVVSVSAVSDTSFFHTCSQTSTALSGVQAKKHVEPDTLVQRKPTLQCATSTPTRPRGPRPRGGNRPSVVRDSTLVAKPNRAGWMGSNATSGAAR